MLIVKNLSRSNFEMFYSDGDIIIIIIIRFLV